ncbi:MAG: RICIN domain-containing protein [Cyanobacteria bacterium P01_D01_bin.128]
MFLSNLKISKHVLRLASVVTVSLLGIQVIGAVAIAQSNSQQLQTRFTGANKCLDIVNDGFNNQLIMADCGNYSGQFWSFDSDGTPPGTYRLRTQFTGANKCLDIVNDGFNNQLIMADCGNYSGQFWSFDSDGTPPGTYRFRTQFTGANKCLDIVNDGFNNQLIMADCGNYSGQFWSAR